MFSISELQNIVVLIKRGIKTSDFRCGSDLMVVGALQKKCEDIIEELQKKEELIINKKETNEKKDNNV